ncbi:MAG: LysM peptidoglycan-binding domain-containing protein [Pirellulaceae bacterium]|nr:LysM peptidoglycan-binding domain-containing protein [Pirellulaceae bacterium]
MPRITIGLLVLAGGIFSALPFWKGALSSEGSQERISRRENSLSLQISAPHALPFRQAIPDNGNDTAIFSPPLKASQKTTVAAQNSLPLEKVRESDPLSPLWGNSRFDKRESPIVSNQGFSSTDLFPKINPNQMSHADNSRTTKHQLILTEVEPCHHKIQDTDTLSSISQKYYKTEQAANLLFNRNRDCLLTPSSLPVGVEIYIPDTEEINEMWLLSHDK